MTNATVRANRLVPTCTSCGHPTEGKGVYRCFSDEDQLISDSFGQLKAGKHLVHKDHCPSNPPPEIIYTCVRCGQDINQSDLAFSGPKWDVPKHSDLHGCPENNEHAQAGHNRKQC